MLAGKLDPTNVTAVPGGPEDGDGVSRTGLAVTVKVADAVVVPAVTVMV